METLSVTKYWTKYIMFYGNIQNIVRLCNNLWCTYGSGRPSKLFIYIRINFITDAFDESWLEPIISDFEPYYHDHVLIEQKYLVKHGEKTNILNFDDVIKNFNHENCRHFDFNGIRVCNKVIYMSIISGTINALHKDSILW